jgi:hypothetical protein
MLRFIAPRLRMPALIALIGTAYAAAWLVHGGHGWVWAIVVEVATAGLAVSTAVSSAAWLPFLVILAVAGFAYLMGLSTYGVGAGDQTDGVQHRSRADQAPLPLTGGSTVTG